MNFEQVKQQEQENLMPTYGRFPVALVYGKGAVAVDTEGKEYIDFTSGIGVNSLGYCDDGWVSAVSKQAGAIQHMSNLYYSPVQTKLAAELCGLTGFGKVFFCNSGAEANECAIKLARKYSADRYGKERTEIVTLVNSFHGRTVTTLAATGQDVFHEHFWPFTAGFSYAKANDFESLLSCVTDNTCAVMIELIQGEGGVMPLEKEFVQKIAALCREKDLLLMVDEVQTGVGRTGTLYCYEQYGIAPDVITSAKGLGGGLPIGACLCASRLGEVMGAGMHGTTFGGNPVACAGGLEILQRVSNDKFLQLVKEKGRYLWEKIGKMEGVQELRGMGMMIGIALKKNNAKDVANCCVKNSLLVLTAKTVVRLLPPLNISYEEMDRGLAILEKSILEG